MPGVVDFDPQGVGICLIWHLSYDGPITGLEVGLDANNITGCASLSNPITVERNSTVTPPTTGTSDVVINEINGSGQIELLNVSGNTIDISSYWLCNLSSSPAYRQLSNMTLVCGGDLILAPGELVTVQGAITINEADGELGLYSTNSFGSSTAILDYVEWGSTGHGRSSVAVGAGIWTTGDFVPAFASGSALLYDGTGDTSGDWSVGVSSPCQSNVVEPGSTNGSFAISGYPLPAINEMTIEIDNMPTSEETLTIQVYDINGAMRQTIKVSAQDSFKLDVSLSLIHI